MPFNELGLPAIFNKALAKLNYETPFPIQREAIPLALKGNDILGIAQTGSGKTAAYALPALARALQFNGAIDRKIKQLILVPTRELAMQVGEVFQEIENELPGRIKILTVHGGVSINPQMIGMQGVHILVATPGRLLDLMDHKALQISEVELLILDEADKMLNLGFKEEMNRIFEHLPKQRQNLLFSATLSDDLNEITAVLLKDPKVVKIESETKSAELIQQNGFFVTEERKGPLLRYLIKKDNLQQVLVFTSSIFKADNVAKKLRKNGIDAESIHGKKSQSARKTALNRFKKNDLQVLVATDLLSRGIDIEFLPHVINYELPRSPKDYIHRIGRTGRATSPGKAISFVTREEIHHFKVIQKKMGTYVDLVESEEFDLQGY